MFVNNTTLLQVLRIPREYIAERAVRPLVIVLAPLVLSLLMALTVHHPPAMSPPFQTSAISLIQALTLSALNFYGLLTSILVFCCFSAPIQLLHLCQCNGHRAALS